MIGFTLYQIHSALNLHFNSKVKYDAFKYNFKTRSSEESFNKSKFKWQYIALEKKICDGVDPYHIQREILIFLWMVYKGNKFEYTRPYDLFGYKDDIRNANRETMIQYLDTDDGTFKKDCIILSNLVDNPLDLYKIDGLYTNIYNSFKKGDINIESILLIDLLIKNIFNPENSSDIIAWPSICKQMELISPFVNYIFDDNEGVTDIFVTTVL